MSHLRYTAPLSVATVVSITAHVLVLSRMDPCFTPGEVSVCQSLSGLSISLFFISLFFVLISLFTLLGFLFRVWLVKGPAFAEFFSISLRQGLLLTFASVLCLFLLLFEVLTWWSGLLVVIVAFLLELYFATRP